MDLSFVKKLKIQTPQDVLRAMVAQFESAESADPVYPYVTVMMGAFAYAGIPVKLETVRSETYLALLSPGRGLQGQDSLSYLPLGAISAVAVDNFRHHLNALAAGMPPTISGEAPTKLALERQAAELSAKTGKTVVCANLEPGAEEGVRFYLASLLRELDLALPRVSADPLGREAVAAISRIQLRFAEGARLDVVKDGAALTIAVGFAQNLKALGEDLQRLIEKAI